MNSSPPSGGVAVISRSGVAVLRAGAAVAISYPFRAHVYTTPFFFAAVFISCWYGRIGPAILATIASTAAIHFLLRLPGAASHLTFTIFRGWPSSFSWPQSQFIWSRRASEASNRCDKLAINWKSK